MDDDNRSLQGFDPEEEAQNAPPGEPVSEGEAAEAEEAPEADAEDPADEEPAEPPSLKRRIKRNIIRFAIIFGFLLVVMIGLMVMLYPNISNYVNTKNASRVISGYGEALSSMSEADYAAILEAAQDYNARLSGAGGTVTDAFTDAGETDRTDEYWSLLDVSGTGMMGYIEIEKLDIRLPLYHGTSEDVLGRGAGHIQGSSLPIGGESAHAVISAHTGLPRAKLFTGVDTLEVGDTFTLYILNEVLTYEVDQILTVLPHEIDALAIERGGDYVTLVTCTPYGINSHRLLVRGTRIETPVDETGDDSGAAAEEETEPGWFRNVFNKIVEFFSFIVEKVAEGLVFITEWGMDLFGVEY